MLKDPGVLDRIAVDLAWPAAPPPAHEIPSLTSENAGGQWCAIAHEHRMSKIRAS
jgi:hypothetical protein